MTIVSPEWIVAPVEPEDAEFLAAVQSASFEDAYLSDDEERNEKVLIASREFLTPERIQKRMGLIMRAAADTDRFYRQARDTRSAAPLGLVYGFKTEDAQELKALYVHPRYFHTGVGRGLAEAFIEWCDVDRDIEVGVVRDNVRAQRFYTQMGFHAVEGERESSYEFLPEITMIRPTGALI